MIRQPIVSVLGHVDHGKTTLLDRIRGTRVTAREAGAITQHIGATEVPLEVVAQVCGDLMKGKAFEVPGLLFIDTPGHHAFTTLRARGGALADLAILVVDVTEGLRPQTVESLRILRQYKTPFLVAAQQGGPPPRMAKAAQRPLPDRLRGAARGHPRGVGRGPVRAGGPALRARLLRRPLRPHRGLPQRGGRGPHQRPARRGAPGPPAHPHRTGAALPGGGAANRGGTRGGHNP